nr:hypothetical protein [Tanacetum cinerariifolium]
NVIAAGADDRPHMFEKSQYNLWHSRMLPYIRGKEHGKDLLDSVLNSSFQYGTVEGEGHMARHCTQLKRPKTSEWFKEKMLHAQALELGLTLGEEQLAFLVDTRDRADSGLNTQTLPTTAIFQTDDAFDSDYNKAPSTNAVLIANYLLMIQMFFLRYQFNTLIKIGIFKEINEMKEVFNQMETKDEQCYVDRRRVEIEKEELLIKNDRFLEQIIFQDIMCIVIHADVENKCVLPANDETLKYAEIEKNYIDEYSRCVELEVELSKKQDMVEKAVYNELLNRCSRLEKYCIFLKIKVQ